MIDIKNLPEEFNDIRTVLSNTPIRVSAPDYVYIGYGDEIENHIPIISTDKMGNSFFRNISVIMWNECNWLGKISKGIFPLLKQHNVTEVNISNNISKYILKSLYGQISEHFTLSNSEKKRYAILYGTKENLNKFDFDLGADNVYKIEVNRFEKNKYFLPKIFNDMVFFLPEDSVIPVCLTETDIFVEKHPIISCCFGLIIKNIEDCAIINFINK